MLNGKVTLHDIQDAEAFVRGTIRRKVRVIPVEDMEDMVAEGLMILLDLARLYDPSRERGKKGGDHVCKGARCCKASFAGYANFLLPKKLREAWHASKPEHMLKTMDDGSRKYVYLSPTVSIDDRDGDTNGHNGEYHSRSVIDHTATRHVGNFIPVPEVG